MSFKSPYPPVEISDSSVYDTLFGSISEEDLDRVAAIDAGATEGTTYRELIARIDGFAGALAARGIGVGDVVGLLSANTSAFAFVFHGILRAGATATTINALFTAKDIAKQLTDSGAKMLVTITQLEEQAKIAAAEVGIPESAVIILNGPGEKAGPNPNAIDLLAAGLPAPDVSFDPATHLAVLPYSSGTTGNPKGVMLTHRNLAANIAQIRPLLEMKASDAILAVLPFFHIYGMTVLLNAALLNRAKLVVMPRFELEQFLSSIQNYKCSYIFIAPPVAVALAKHPMVDEYDLSSVNTIMSGAAPLDEQLGNAVAKRLGTQVIQGYGMSELSPVSHVIPVDNRGGPQAPLNSCGWPIPNTVNKIVDPVTGEDIEIPAEGMSEAGELWVSGPNVMVGYLNNDAATAETIDADGFLHTGDMATVDSHGFVYIVDRLKELIKYKGYQVPPAELEALLLTHADVDDVAVVGVIEEETGEEIPKAFVVKREGSELTGEQVIEFVASQVSPHKKVRAVEFIEAIPKSAAGKILRKDLRK
ncbi:UNVERIFIED_CONTAM: acyl-CoA synthetase (AMP-forming)/AMP-acid ligase II [Williamsia faeni]